MSTVAVQKVHSDVMQSHPIIEDLKTLKERVRQRAFQLFERCGRRDGSALGDWLEAETDLLLIPGSDLIEADDRFELEVALPGFEAEDIEVIALPNALLVRDKNMPEQEPTEGNVQLYVGGKCLYQLFELPMPIDVDNVTGRLNKGLLKVTAPKPQKLAEKYSAAAA